VGHLALPEAEAVIGWAVIAIWLGVMYAAAFIANHIERRNRRKEESS
jgi:hypothetical protein